MAKFAGLVGYGSQVETSPGIWEIDEKTLVMKGDLIRQNANIIESDHGYITGIERYNQKKCRSSTR